MQRLGEIDAGLDMRVVRNDEITPEEAIALDPRWLLLSPGPCTPAETGVCGALIDHFRGRIPVLGVCLGHQTIAAQSGLVVERHHRLMHGKTSPIHHDGRGIFAGLPNPFVATRYHSLAAIQLPDVLVPNAWSEDDVVQGIRHVDLPIHGVQFHPESVLTTEGPRLVENWLRLVSDHRFRKKREEGGARRVGMMDF